MPLRGFAHLKPLPSHLVGRTLARRLDDLPRRLSRNSRGWPRGVVRSGMTEELVSMQVECEPLEETPDVEDPIAAPLEHLHAVVETLHKPAGLPTHEVVR